MVRNILSTSRNPNLIAIHNKDEDSDSMDDEPIPRKKTKLNTEAQSKKSDEKHTEKKNKDSDKKETSNPAPRKETRSSHQGLF